MRKSTDTIDGNRLDLLESMSYETRDVSLGTLMKWLAFLFFFIAATSLFVNFVLYPLFVPRSAEIERISPLDNPNSPRRFPPSPQLQTYPVRDMIEYRTAEKQAVESYGTGAKPATATIPIDRAIDIYSERGISGVKGTTAPPKVNAYPGSGIYDSPDPVRSNNDKAGDMTSEGNGGANALQSGDANVPASHVEGASNVAPAPKPAAPAPPGPAPHHP